MFMSQEFIADTIRLRPAYLVRMCATIEWSDATERVPISEKAFTPADLNQGFVVAIEIVAKAGEEDVVSGALEALIKPTMAESGVKLFLPYRSPTDPAAFFIFELYQNEAGWAEHQRTAHFKSFVDNMLPRIARRERVPYVPYAPNT